MSACGNYYKLALRVVVPVVVGQLLQTIYPSVVAFNKKYKKTFQTGATIGTGLYCLYRLLSYL
jgi:predicted Na+-dependent transporter